MWTAAAETTRVDRSGEHKTVTFAGDDFFSPPAFTAAAGTQCSAGPRKEGAGFDWIFPISDAPRRKGRRRPRPRSLQAALRTVGGSGGIQAGTRSGAAAHARQSRQGLDPPEISPARAPAAWRLRGVWRISRRHRPARGRIAAPGRRPARPPPVRQLCRHAPDVDGRSLSEGRLLAHVGGGRPRTCVPDRCERRVPPGYIPDTFAHARIDQLAYAHVDVDLYQSVLDCVEYVYPKLVPGGILMFDDYGFPSCSRAREAADRAFASRREKPIYLPTGQALVLKLA